MSFLETTKPAAKVLSPTDHFNVGEIVEFHPKVFTQKCFKPYYDKYKNHKFEIIKMVPEHIKLKCIDDPLVIVDGMVHDDEIVLIGDQNASNTECEK